MKKIYTYIFLLIFSLLLAFGCSELDEDNLPESEQPEVNLIKEDLPDTLQGSVLIKAQVSDNIGVTDVYLTYIDALGEEISNKMNLQGDHWQTIWEPPNYLPEGSYTLVVEAYDRADNVGKDEKTIYYAPQSEGVFFTTLTNGGFYYGNIAIELSPMGIIPDRVELFIDDVSQGTLTQEPWTFQWDTTTEAFGSVHYLKAITHDINDEMYETLITVTIGAEPVALGELFTATWCTNCPLAEAKLHELKEEYPDNFTAIEYHGVGSHFNVPASLDRISYYELSSSYPIALFSGGELIYGTDDEDLLLYEEEVESIISQASRFDIEFAGNINDGFMVTVIAASDSIPANIFLRTGIIEDGLVYQDETYNSVLREMSDDKAITQLNAIGDFQEFTIEYEIDEDWVAENLTVVAFIQSDDNQNVYQAAELK